MPRYIDADELKRVLADAGLIRSDLIALRHIDEIPTADVQEVVRCKDCVYFVEDLKCLYCDLLGSITHKDDFCSSGCRKEGKEK